MFDKLLRRERLSQKPVAIPLKYSQKPPMDDHIRSLVRNELSRAAEAQGMDTFEEANDFTIEGEYEPRSPYELDDDLAPISELKARKKEAEEAAKKAAEPPAPPTAPPAGDK